MAGLVEEVAEPDDTSSFASEIHCECGSTACEQPGYGVQFLAAVVQIIFGHNEIGCAESCAGGEQNAILTVPKWMAGGFRQCCGLRNPHRSYRLHRGRYRRKQSGGDLLRSHWRAHGQSCQQNRHSATENRPKSGIPRKL